MTQEHRPQCVISSQAQTTDEYTLPLECHDIPDVASIDMRPGYRVDINLDPNNVKELKKQSHLIGHALDNPAEVSK